MFRFWSSDSKGSDKTVELSQPMLDCDSPPPRQPDGHSVEPVFTPVVRPPKRKAPTFDGCAQGFGHVKRSRVEANVATPPETPAVAHREYFAPHSPEDAAAADLDRAREVIQCQIGLEILLKHDELRLIDQELAKCQIALEQLRRCHLIPYPVTCPTPQQMLDIQDGKGPSVRDRSGAAPPRWAPPFGVVDGPYARHYAKWLIPDPAFDGMLPDWQGIPDANKSRMMLEGRTTRNSFTESGPTGKGRPARGMAGSQKLHALSSGYPQPKEKAGPCVLRRADGQTVKLVCLDCHRENFSSTQGFINHCRIAHKRDFKSHEEAAVHCGHPIEVDEVGAVVGEDRPTGAATSSGLVHPLARGDDMDEQGAYAALRSRIQESLKMYHEGKLPGVVGIPGAVQPAPSASVGPAPARKFEASSETPYLSRLLQARQFDGSLKDRVEDAKTQDDDDDVESPAEDSEEEPQTTPLEPPAGPLNVSASAARVPVVMRMPARATMSPIPLNAATRPASSKGRSPHLALATSAKLYGNGQAETAGKEDEDSGSYEDDEMEVDLSPNISASNNAPSLVSDDGEYDDSDDDSSSDTSESIEAESVSDVTEIKIEDDHGVQVHEVARPIRHHRGSTGKRDENKHVTFVSSLPSNARGRKKQKA